MTCIISILNSKVIILKKGIFWNTATLVHLIIVHIYHPVVGALRVAIGTVGPQDLKYSPSGPLWNKLLSP